MRLNLNDYRDKAAGCWLGKNIGGTLGAPFEWRRQINNVSFYVQKDLNGQPVPNDDLDIQLLWLRVLETRGIEINAHTLAEYWVTYVTPHWAEYGTAKINMRQGLLPPLSGAFRNVYKHSCGAYIRSEIWACIAPGMPRVAARYAYEDAILDHGDGEGMYAEIFMAALESAAFVVPDLATAIEIGLSYIPAASEVARAVHTVLQCFEKKMDWKEARDEVLRLHRGKTFMGSVAHTSKEDQEKGFVDGMPGFDVPSNIGMTLIGLLWGGDDFGKTVCTAVNCGEDTDCTGATAGSVWGILHGAGAIPEKWIKPIGRGIRTIVLNLGDLSSGFELPGTVDELADRTIRIGRQVCLRNNELELAENQPSDVSDANAGRLAADDAGESVWRWKKGPRFDFEGFSFLWDYGEEGPLIRPNIPKKVRITIFNTSRIQANLSLRWYLPEGWQILPGRDCYALSFPGFLGEPETLEFDILASRLDYSTHRGVLEVTLSGRPTVMLMPLVLLNGAASQ